MERLELDRLDKDSVESFACYLLDVAKEYEVDDPVYAHRLLSFRNKKIERINELISEILEESEKLEDYTSFVEKPAKEK